MSENYFDPKEQIVVRTVFFYFWQQHERWIDKL